MLGPPKPRRLDQPIAISLEQLVPSDHFYRHLEAKLDPGFVRDLVRTTYSGAEGANQGRTGRWKHRSLTADRLNQADGRTRPGVDRDRATYHCNNASHFPLGAAFFNK